MRPGGRTRLTATILRKDEQADAAWLEDEDGEPVLCMDTDHGQTVSIKLSPKAFAGIVDGIEKGPMNKRGSF